MLIKPRQQAALPNLRIKCQSTTPFKYHLPRESTTSVVLLSVHGPRTRPRSLPTATGRTVRITHALPRDVRASIPISRSHTTLDSLSSTIVWLGISTTAASVVFLSKYRALAHARLETAAVALAVSVLRAGTRDILGAWTGVARVATRRDVVGLIVSEAASPVDLHGLNGTFTPAGVETTAGGLTLRIALAGSGNVLCALRACEESHCKGGLVGNDASW